MMIGEYDPRQPSTHVVRDLKSQDEDFENLMDQWGAWRDRGPTELLASITRYFIYNLSLAKSDIPQPKETIVCVAKVPNYWIHPRMNRIDNAIAELKYFKVLIEIYENNAQMADLMKKFNWSYDTAKSRVCDARREAKNHPVIKKELRRA